MSFSPEQQKEIQKLQQMQQQFEQIRNHRMQLERRENELKTTMETIENIEDTEQIYKSVGQLLLKTDIGTAKNDVKDELEQLETKLISVRSSEKSLEERFQAAQEKFRSSMGQ